MTGSAITTSGHFGRRHRLRRRRDLQHVFKRGRRARGRHLSVAVTSGQCAWSRLGLAVSKASGNSPERARIKRLLREAFRARREAWPVIDVIAMCRTPWPGATLALVTEELDALVTRSRAPRRARGKR